ncbi:MAG: hypothetical protein ACE5I1_01835 [bacterium]
MLIVVCTALSIPFHIYAQAEPEKIHPAQIQESQAPPKGVPVDVQVKKVTLRYGSEVSFYMPDGEFAAFFRKKFGYFSTITQARYNFLRGEIEFKNETFFAKYKIAPQFVVTDRLMFVPLFDRDNIWRREQTMQVGLLLPIRHPFQTLTSFKFTRYTYPSLSKPQNLESYRALGFSQAFSAEIDSSRIFGMPFRGAIHFQIDKAFPYTNSNANFWQLSVRGWQTSELPYVTITNAIDRIALVKGNNPPLRFLGGMDKLSAYHTNELSGYGLSYFSSKIRVHLLCSNHDFYRNWGIARTDFVIHLEAASLAGGKNASNTQAFHTSLGMGLQIGCSFGGDRLFNVFFLAYNRIDPSGQPRFYFGVKF